MHSYEIRFPGFDARSNRGLIRWELFLHRDVRDVLLTTREDTLQVVFRGEPDTTGWSHTLVEAGFPAPYFESPAGGAVVVDGPRAAA